MKAVVRACLSIIICATWFPASADSNGAPDQIPIFVHAIAGNPDIVNVRDHGLLIDWLDRQANRVNEPDLAAMYEVLADVPLEQRFEDAFSCMFAAEDDPCQPVVLLDAPPLAHTGGTEALETAFADHGVSKAWVLQVTEQAFQAGYTFTVNAVELEVTPERNVRHRYFIVMYRDVFLDGSDAHSRGLQRDDRDADPRIGSHEARALYWQSGTPPRMEQLVRDAPGGAAEMLRYLAGYTEGMSTRDFNQAIKSLDRVRDSNLGGGARCRARWGLCNMRIADFTEERVRVLSGGSEPWMMSLNISGLY